MTTRKTASAKPKRTPVSGARDILNFNEKKDGYVYRWVNDKDNRIQRFLEAGYTFVGQDADNRGQLISGDKSINNSSGVVSGVITKSVGKGDTSYLMAISEEYYEEDQSAKQTQIDKVESALTKTSGQDGRYGDVNISRKGRVGKL